MKHRLTPERTVALLNEHRATAWERWPDALRKQVKAIGANADGIARAVTFGPRREYYYVKHEPDGTSRWVHGVNTR